MKKPVKTVLISLVAAAAITCAADSPRDIAATRALVKEHARSAVAVEVRFKAPEGDESTGFNIPYMCPNCNRTHYNGRFFEWTAVLCAGCTCVCDIV